jgi:hypothetical protein
VREVADMAYHGAKKSDLVIALKLGASLRTRTSRKNFRPIILKSSALRGQTHERLCGNKSQLREDISAGVKVKNPRTEMANRALE